MTILVIDESGTIGSAIVDALGSAHDVIPVSRSSGINADIRDPESIKAMYRQAGKVVAVVCAAGSVAST